MIIKLNEQYELRDDGDYSSVNLYRYGRNEKGVPKQEVVSYYGTWKSALRQCLDNPELTMELKTIEEMREWLFKIKEISDHITKSQ